MTMLNVEKYVFQRDETGKLIPIKVVIESLPDKPEMKLTPMVKGEMQKMILMAKEAGNDSDADAEIISKHCVEPEIGVDKAKDLLPNVSMAIMTAILSISVSKSQEEISKSIEVGSKAKLLEDENFLSKKG